MNSFNNQEINPSPNPFPAILVEIEFADLAGKGLLVFSGRGTAARFLSLMPTTSLLAYAKRKIALHYASQNNEIGLSKQARCQPGWKSLSALIFWFLCSICSKLGRDGKHRRVISTILK
jgi:hypothetical protein